MKFMKLIDKINQAANKYNKTKNERYKKEWYKLIEEYSRLYAIVK
jgi:translation initiation factor 2 alpha subunit (eIF-2alpha)